MKKALIRQPAGLGDILWIQSIVDHISSRGFEVMYPVCDQYYDMVSTSVKTKNSNFIRESDLDDKLLNIYKTTNPVIEPDFEYYPFDCISHPKYESFRPEYALQNIMIGKYLFYKEFNPEFDVEASDWRESIEIIRNYDREKKYENSINLNLNEKYIWANKIFGTPPDVIHRDMNLPQDIRVVENNHEVENIFDMCGVLENANEIHTVETCFCYIIELLNVNKDLNLYSRKINGQNQQKDFSYIDMVYKKDWKKYL